MFVSLVISLAFVIGSFFSGCNKQYEPAPEIPSVFALEQTSITEPTASASSSSTTEASKSSQIESASSVANTDEASYTMYNSKHELIHAPVYDSNTICIQSEKGNIYLNNDIISFEMNEVSKSYTLDTSIDDENIALLEEKYGAGEIFWGDNLWFYQDDETITFLYETIEQQEGFTKTRIIKVCLDDVTVRAFYAFDYGGPLVSVLKEDDHFFILLTADNTSAAYYIYHISMSDFSKLNYTSGILPKENNNYGYVSKLVIYDNSLYLLYTLDSTTEKEMHIFDLK